MASSVCTYLHQVTHMISRVNSDSSLHDLNSMNFVSSDLTLLYNSGTRRSVSP